MDTVRRLDVPPASFPAMALWVADRMLGADGLGWATLHR